MRSKMPKKKATMRPSCLMLSFLMLVSSSVMAASPIAATATTCPDLITISRTPGIYSWTSTVPGWEGSFSAPQYGRGYSNKIKLFTESRWIQFSNLPDSPGYIQCDYTGDIGQETIRFSQTRNKATKRPDNENWAHVENLRFPSVQRTCSYSVHLCTFEQL